MKIRLVNPANNNTGRVEIFHPSFGWGTVCGDSRWDNTESGGVVCHQLGFAGASATRKYSYYGQGTGPTLQISQKFDYCISLKYALKLSLHIKCLGKVSGYAGKNAHDMFLFSKSCASSNLIIFCFLFLVT